MDTAWSCRLEFGMKTENLLGRPAIGLVATPGEKFMSESPITFRAPPENAAAYRAAAEKAGVPLGRWINDTLTAALSKSVRKSLPEPRAPGRPRKTEPADG